MMEADQTPRTTIRSFTINELAAMFAGTSSDWWHRMLPTLRQSGILTRRGRKHFGTVDQVSTWLTNDSVGQ